MQVARPRPESHISGVLPKPRFAIDRGSESALPLSTLESCLQSKQRTIGLQNHILEVPTLSNVSVFGLQAVWYVLTIGVIPLSAWA